MPATVILIDKYGLITSFNDEAEAVFGKKLSGRSPHKYAECFSDNARLVAFIRDALNSGKTSKSRIHILRDRDKGEYFVSSSVLKDYKGRFRGILIVLNDTENNRNDAKQIRSEKLEALGTMAAGMAHEIKNPLSSIKVLSRLLSDRFDDEEYRKRFLEIMPKEISRMDRIVESMLGYVRASDLKVEKVDLKNLLEESMEFMEEQFKSRKIKVSVKAKGDLKISADTQKLFQMLLNLLQNAACAMEEGGELKIDISRIKNVSGDMAELVIADNGCGISKEDLKNIFDPFFTTRYGGTGLGLTVVHGIIESHGGSIDVESKEGTGTVFTIKIPSSQE